MIPTKTLKFWGFKEHPFADNILRDGLLKLFVDRRLRVIAEKLRLVFDAVKVPSGKTTMNVLRMPKLPKGW